jgi:hypothetical protein
MHDVRFEIIRAGGNGLVQLPKFRAQTKPHANTPESRCVLAHFNNFFIVTFR